MEPQDPEVSSQNSGGSPRTGQHPVAHPIISIAVLLPVVQTLRPFLASCQKYLALLGSPPNTSMMHVGTFISLSSKLAVAAAPYRYRLSKGLLNQRLTIKELQVREHDPTCLCARDPRPALLRMSLPLPVMVPSEPRPRHRLAGLPAGCFWPAGPEPGRPGPAA